MEDLLEKKDDLCISLGRTIDAEETRRLRYTCRLTGWRRRGGNRSNKKTKDKMHASLEWTGIQKHYSEGSYGVQVCV